VTLNAVLQNAYAMRTASDSFDVALSGFADLVAAGRFEDADALARETFRQWRVYEREHPEFVQSYALP
jgi:energy-converting hydrogenase A subunit M